MNVQFKKIRRMEVVAQMCSVKKVFLEILEDSQENYLCQSLFFSLYPVPLLASILHCLYH